ncbi:MAG: PEGA domain-containing protein [Paludibacteraceae bacterium]|nr:PEGA domain-containing protein [Paludibacteraceae bacterium]MBQ8713806.1 PEGA domain-containing protein [Prevotella sp.]
MKKLILLIFVCLVTLTIGAQNIKVLKFERLEKDMTANTHGTQKLDQNGEKAALIKIQAPDRGFTFNGGSLGIVASEEHDGEIWLYVPRRAKKLTIQHKDYGVLREYYYPVTIDGARTYEMYLDIGIGRYVTITSQMANSTIYIDGEPVGQSPINHKYLNYGRHTVRALKDRYEGETSFIITTEDDPGLRLINVEQRDMSDHFGDVTVNVENKAEIWFEGKNVGNGSWQTQLREGSYVVETRKADCDPEKTSFTVVALTNNIVQAAPPTPHTGRLSLYTRPRNAVATINGTDPIDLTESHTLPIGTYQINLSRKGYVSKSGLEYKVNHNQTTRDTITLERVQYIKPTSFYFGAGYTIRSLGGINVLAGATYKNFDFQVSYTFGLGASDDVPWYSTDGNDTYLSSISYKRSTLAFKLGYQFALTERLGIVPQFGYEVERLSGTVENGTNLYGDGAAANCLSLGAKLLYAPMERFYLFANPAVSFGVSKDDNFERLTDNSDISAGGFMMTLGAIFNF